VTAVVCLAFHRFSALTKRRYRSFAEVSIGRFERSIIRTVFPGGIPPPSAGKDACRHGDSTSSVPQAGPSYTFG
jgi:hypothetical protein